MPWLFPFESPVCGLYELMDLSEDVLSRRAPLIFCWVSFEFYLPAQPSFFSLPDSQSSSSIPKAQARLILFVSELLWKDADSPFVFHRVKLLLFPLARLQKGNVSSLAPAGRAADINVGKLQWPLFILLQEEVSAVTSSHPRSSCVPKLFRPKAIMDFDLLGVRI